MPGPVSYNKHIAIDNLKSKTKLGSFYKANHPSYFTEKVTRSFSPGPGAYKNVESAKDHSISPKLSTIRSKRH